MPVKFDPDAPWWANLLVFGAVAIIIAGIPSYFAYRATRESRRAADTAESIHIDTTEQLRRVLSNVENSHPIGLRDDLDGKMARLLTAVRALTSGFEELVEELKSARLDLGTLHEEVRTAKAGVRRNRSQITHLDRVVDHVVEQVQEVLDDRDAGVILSVDPPQEDKP